MVPGRHDLLSNRGATATQISRAREAICAYHNAGGCNVSMSGRRLCERTSFIRPYKTLRSFHHLPTRNGYTALLNFSPRPRDSLGKSATAIEEFEAWFVLLKTITRTP